jgi:MFS transporter, DHA3 family, multidrug efflux protein
MRVFYHLLGNTIIASITNFTVWFALIFFSYLETKSVLVTSISGGIYLAFVALSGFWLGSIVDHNRKKTVMLLSSVVSLILYVIGLILYFSVPPEAFKDQASVALWALIVISLAGVIAGNLRTIALPTVVTILVPEDRRDKANGLVGMVMGVSFLIVSVISGLLIGYGGMHVTLALAIVTSLIAIAHLAFINIPEKEIVHTEDAPKKIDLKGTLRVINLVPGLLALILFATFNNFLGGVYMALMDAYGLSLVSVQVWGFLWGVLSTGFIIGGLIIAKWGLGKNPLKTLFMTNVIIWSVSAVFTIQPSIWLLAAGMMIYLTVMPFIEASEHTIIQKVVPLERQGRVFGFAQSVEQSASPFTAFLIGPIAQFIFIPFMTTGAGVALIGDWFGTGPDRGMALVFTLAGVIGLIVTIIAFNSKYYRMLRDRYMKAPEPVTVEEKIA